LDEAEDAEAVAAQVLWKGLGDDGGFGGFGEADADAGE
jgi:hypothetical protein